MKKPKLDLSANNIINCAVYAIIGLLLVIFQSAVLQWMMTLFGVLLIVLGIVEIVQNKENLVPGIVKAAIGVLVIVLGWWLTEFAAVVFGIILVIKGAIEIWEKHKDGFKALLSPIVTVVIGVLVIFAFGSIANIVCIIAGVVFLINAVLGLFGKSLSMK